MRQGGSVQMRPYRLEWADTASVELRWTYDFDAPSDKFAIEVARANLKRMTQCDSFILWAEPQEIHPRYVALLTRETQVEISQSEGPY